MESMRKNLLSTAKNFLSKIERSIFFTCHNHQQTLRVTLFEIHFQSFIFFLWRCCRQLERVMIIQKGTSTSRRIMSSKVVTNAFHTYWNSYMFVVICHDLDVLVNIGWSWSVSSWLHGITSSLVRQKTKAEKAYVVDRRQSKEHSAINAK